MNGKAFVKFDGAFDFIILFSSDIQRPASGLSKPSRMGIFVSRYLSVEAFMQERQYEVQKFCCKPGAVNNEQLLMLNVNNVNINNVNNASDYSL